ncbi:aspartyl-phosphate phosphatase Spo0E family protein [Anaerobacillus alkaliphilus]|uniref:Aspartyl-phosphate phosphatase Spo0E family protein n=2 Tax=Anaerobacillus alkaliphilus TaxID=1548597 RepID=A0A4Q0VUE2_9BACI|nr:aspartyl-phosphate phosphatase Spo0E family protein [Anaerobacillus alkaliphilus]
MGATLGEIEEARKHMIKLAYENPLNSQVVIDASTKLDKLLNTINNCIYRK